MRKVLLMLLCWSAWSQADIFSKPKNLKVLADEISPTELRETMKMFSQSLGVRCQHCHVGEADQPLTEFDFAADDKAAKDKARFMYQMVQDLNQHLVTGIKDRTVTVACITCHRGQAKPIQTVDMLRTTLEQDGLAAALTQHDELKARFYGSHTHDFTENTLLTLATRHFTTDPAVSRKILEKNLIMHPNGIQTLVTLGEWHLANQAPQEALRHFKQAHELQPNPWLQQKIQAVTEQLAAKPPKGE